MTTTEIKEEPGTPAAANTDDNSSNIGKTVSAKKAARFEPHDLRDRDIFYKDLQNFHENRNTPITRFPKINGREVDLHKLYWEVISRGGWLKVNIRNEWDELLNVLDLKLKCVNAAVALKHIYTRYLDKFEKANFLGEDPDKNDEPEEEGRHKKWSSKSFNSVPMTYNYNQHEVSHQLRIIHKLSTDLYKGSEYDKLLLSLISPLPNEQDFAINVCTLMANESKHTLRIEHCPKLLDALMAHAGVFCHSSMRDLFYELYTKIRRHSLQSFWNDCLDSKPQILELTYDDYFQTPDERFSDFGAGHPPLRLGQKEIFQDGLNATAEDCSAMNFNNLDFLALGRGLGTHDYIGQRIHQVSSIIRNLSFFEENVTTLAKNRTFIRFLVMSSNIRWGNIHHMALDVCGNIATELELSDPTSDDLTRLFLSTICEGLEGQDRGVIISCLEILYKLCQKDINAEHIHKCLDQKVYDQISLFLSLNDIMLLLYTLECIYALSSLGFRSCNSLIQVKGIVDTLVSLITVEAQSYGPDGCVLMRVVETVPGNMLPMVAQNIANLQNAAMAGQVNVHMQQPVNQDNTTPSEVVTNPKNSINQNHPAPSLANVKIVQTPTPLKELATSSSNPTIPKQIQQQQQQKPISENEQFALTWLTATFEPTPNHSSRIEQQELYKMYLNATQKSGRKGLVSAIHFPSLVRKALGITVGPNLIKTTDAAGTDVNAFCYVCIRAKANPLPMQTKPMSGTSNTHSIKVPIKVHQQISKKSSDNVIKSETPTKVKTTKKAQQLQKLQQQNQSPQTPSQQTGIKSHVIQQHQSVVPNSLDRPHPVGKLPGKNIIINKNIIATPHQQSSQVISVNQGSAVITHTGNQPATSQQQQQMQQISLQQQVKSTSAAQISATPNTINGNGAASSLIKSLLANKVTSTATEVSETNASAAPNNPSCLITQNVNLHQVAQRQHLQKQKELAQQQQTIIKAPQNVALPTTTISALVQNPIIQSNAVKVGQTTIKAITTNTVIPASIIEKRNAQIASEVSDNSNWDPIPPLAPLSASARLGASNQIIIEDSNSTGNNSVASSVVSSVQINTTDDGEGSDISFEGLLVPKSKSGCSSVIEDDGSSKDSLKPPHSVGLKRKLDDEVSESDNKRRVVDSGLNDSEDEGMKVTPSKTAANLYAEIAASILEDEDLEEVTPMPAPAPVPIQTSSQSQIQTPVIQKTIDAQKQLITMPIPLQRQIIVGPQNTHQMILSPASNPNNAQNQQSATATIKTESGLQTVPVILQKQVGPNGQQIIQPVIQQQQQQTQYVLATNPQGQTYLVAQQPQPTQTVLVTQTPQQQGTTSKTIIILQQQGGAPQAVAQPQLLSTQGTPQKVIMTTPQGQQMIVTQVPRPMQHQIIMNPTTNVSQTTPIMHQQSQMHVQAQHQQIQKQIQIQTQPQVQIQAPAQQTMLSQLPHIPATIKLQAHQTQTTQTQTIPKTLPAKTPVIAHQSAVTLVAPSQAAQSQATQVHQQQPKILERKQPEAMQQLSASVSVTQPSAQSQQVIQQTVNRPQTPLTLSNQPPQHTSSNISQTPPIITPPPPPSTTKNSKTIADIKSDEELIDPNWMWVCDWRNCPRKKFKSLGDVYYHACKVHCPESLDASAEIYCQWGPGPGLCDNIPRKRFSLMTHLLDRHCTVEAFKAAVQRRLVTGIQSNIHCQPVTIIKNTQAPVTTVDTRGTASPTLSTSSSSSLPPSASAAMHAIKRHTADFANPKELMTTSSSLTTSSNESTFNTSKTSVATSSCSLVSAQSSTSPAQVFSIYDENEGPVTKSIRLTAALILRNLVTYTTNAKRNVRYYEPHLAGVALSNVESSQVISQILYEMNN